MSDPLIRECDHYVVIEGSKQEKFLNHDQTIEWLKSWLDNLEKNWKMYIILISLI